MQGTDKIRYPEVVVAIAESEKKHAFEILWIVDNALMKHGVDEATRQVFILEATGNDYGHLLDTCRKWVTIKDK